MKLASSLCAVFLLVPCLTAEAAPVSREQLLEMVESGVSPRVVLQLVERDCVDFEVTPEVLIELSASVPQEVLEAAIACRSGSAAAAFGRDRTEQPMEPPLALGDVRVLAMIPATLDGHLEEGLTAAFVDALKTHKPRYTVVDPVELALHFEGEESFDASAPISSLLGAARGKGADALVLVTGTSYRRFDDPGIRLDVKIVEANQGKVLWTGGDKGVSNFYNKNAAMKNASRNTVKIMP